jgi:hypothetical protein
MGFHAVIRTLGLELTINLNSITSTEQAPYKMSTNHTISMVNSESLT